MHGLYVFVGAIVVWAIIITFIISTAGLLILLIANAVRIQRIFHHPIVGRAHEGFKLPFDVWIWETLRTIDESESTSIGGYYFPLFGKVHEGRPMTQAEMDAEDLRRAQPILVDY